MNISLLIPCKVKDVVWLSSTVFKVVFDPKTKFKYQAGQFVSVAIPTHRERPLHEWHSYTLACPYETAETNGYEIYVRYISGGMASEYLSFLRKGDEFTITSPHGDFRFVPPSTDKDVVFIATTSGIASIKAIVESEEFQKNKPARTYLLLGTRNEEESLFTSYFEKLGLRVIPAVTKPKILTFGFWGRVTDFLERGVFPWNAKNADYYVVGNPKMVKRVLYQLNLLQKVDRKSIFIENIISQFSFEKESTEAEVHELVPFKKSA